MYVVAIRGAGIRIPDDQACRSGSLTITPTLLPDNAAAMLIAHLDTELAVLYPGLEYNHLKLRPEQTMPGKGVFLIARAGDEPVGCGAVRRAGGITGEIKRMYVVPSARRTGVARCLLAELERYARKMGMHRLVLHTGRRQPEAIHLYESTGFTPTSCYEPYTDADTGICMIKVISRKYPE